jgi:hypothetical protein
LISIEPSNQQDRSLHMDETRAANLKFLAPLDS